MPDANPIDNHEGAGDEPAMERRRVEMPDGRYMYYYTFGDASEAAPSDASRDSSETSDV